MPERLRVYVPLNKFRWTGEQAFVFPGIEVRRMNSPDLRGLEKQLSKIDQDNLLFARYWLCFDHVAGQVPSSAEIVNIFLLALWLAKPTKTYASLRFEMATDQADGHVGTWHHFLDRFSWIDGYTDDQVLDSDLSAVTGLFTALRDYRLRGDRLSTALFLTMAGCMAHQWKIAFICFSAAVEAMLTYAIGKGSTKRLAMVYASLVAGAPADREVAFVEFCELYSIRSDIMHGRSYSRASMAEENLALLARFEEILRRLWRAVVTAPEVAEIMESGDDVRKQYFEGIQAGWQPRRK